MNNYARSVLMLSAVFLASNVLGFVREILIAGSFGVSDNADAFLTAFSIVSFFCLIFTAGTVQSAFMPRYQSLVTAGTGGGARALFILFLKWFLVLLTLCVMALVIGAVFWTRQIVPGFGAEKADLTAHLVKWMGPMVLFVGVGALLQSVLHAHQRFFAPAFVPFLNNVIIIAFLLLVVPWTGATGLAAAFLSGSVLWILVLGPLAVRRLPSDMNAGKAYSECRAVLVLMLPLLLMLVADNLSGLVQKGLVSGLESGSIAALHYANKLAGMPVGIFGIAVSTVSFPALVDALAKKHADVVHGRFFEGLKGILILAAPASVFMIVKAETIVRVLFERGAFDAHATSATSPALVWYSICIVPQCLMLYYNRIFFAAQNTKLPMMICLVTEVFQIFFCWAGVRSFGYLGNAVGNAAYVYLYAAVLRFHLRRVLPDLRFSLFRAAWRVIAAAVGMGLVLYLVPPGAGIPGFAITILIGGASYGVFLIVLGEKAVFDLALQVKAQLLRGR